MSREIAHQDHARTGQPLYCVIDRGGRRWDGASFVVPAEADWASYVVPLVEDAGTGHFTADVPAAITTPGRLDVTVLRRIGPTPAPIDTNVAFATVGWDGQADTAWDPRVDPTAICQGLLTAATSSTATLSATAAPPAGMDLAGNGVVCITGGAGRGQVARVASYDANTRVVTIDGSWSVTPDASSFVRLYIDQSIDVWDFDVVSRPYTGTRAGALMTAWSRLATVAAVNDAAPTATAFRLGAGAATVDGAYVGQQLAIVQSSVPGLQGQRRTISGYTGATRAVSFVTGFTTAPANADLIEVI